MKKKILLILFLLCVTVACAQQKLKKANKLFADMAYPDAIAAYEKYIEKGHKLSKATITNLADAYYFTGDTGNALRWYTRLEKQVPDKMDVTHCNRYVQSLRMQGKKAKADEVHLSRLELNGDAKAKTRVLKQKKYLDSIILLPPKYTLSHLPSNTDKADFGTAFYGDKIVYSSSKDATGLGRKTYIRNRQPFLELLIVERDSVTGAFKNENKFFPKQMTAYHTAGLVFTNNLSEFYFSANTVTDKDKLKDDKKGTNNVGISRTMINGEELTNIYKPAFNNVAYSTGHPALSSDGKWLYFSSDMPGGYGEADIYRAAIKEDGTVGNPVNLGPEINTSGREMFPFINNNSLYFASDGHYGLGGLDVFKSEILNDSTFSEPYNQGAGLNSIKDDFAFIIDKEGRFGYISSNRDDGTGDDDIYYFTIEPKDIPANQEEIASVPEPNEKPVPVSDTINTIGNDDDYKKLIKREGDIEKIAVNPIYFDLDKYDITPQAAAEMDKVVVVMAGFKDMVIMIESHTDSRATHAYNRTLSANRAKATYNYIISKGINPGRIVSAKGYGETRLLNNCSDGVECSETEHAINRRSDFIIVKK